MRAFVGFCIREYDLSLHLLTRLDAPKMERKVLSVFTPDQVEALLKAATGKFAQRDRAIVATLFDTGVRISELLTLTLDRLHISPEDAYAEVHGKGRRNREVGLGQRSRREVHRYISRHRQRDGAPYVFLSQHGRQLSKQAVTQMLKRLAERATVEGVRVSPHTARHSYAVFYLGHDGADVYKLSRLMGHSRVATTEGYLRAFSAREARRGPSVLDSL
jgi:integrase/recombinase XerD